MRVRVFFDTAPDYNCTRIEAPSVEGRFSDLPPTATNVSIIDSNDIPRDRTFRDAWKPDLTVDIPKAREIVKAIVTDPRQHAAIDATQTEEELKALLPT